MGGKSKRTGAYTEQKSADKYAAEITALVEPLLLPDISDTVWLTFQTRLSRLVIEISGEKNHEDA